MAIMSPNLAMETLTRRIIDLSELSARPGSQYPETKEAISLLIGVARAELGDLLAKAKKS